MAKTEWLTLVQQREVKRQEILSGEQETMRQKLEDHARLVVIDYRKGWEQHLPTAKQKLDSIIQPWFDEASRKGEYAQLIEFLKAHGRRNITLSETIYYPWPRQAYVGLLDEPRPFATDALRLGNREAAQPTVRDNEVWSATFHIERDGNNTGIAIARWPTDEASFDLTREPIRDLVIHTGPREISDATAKIHPFVWIEFAEQVKEGKVDAVLTTSLQRILCPELSRFVRGHEYYHTQSLARDAYLAGKSD
ncbi:MAG: hypothetical protein HYV40_02985 [Candidatus Levybacteria bacterium]|nr:hypothetical protein [Candidatus Levybacteria bacterium]